MRSLRRGRWEERPHTSQAAPALVKMFFLKTHIHARESTEVAMAAAVAEMVENECAGGATG